MSGYALTFGLVLVPAGPPRRHARPADHVHRRASAVFTLSSLLAGLAPTALLLVVARLVAGHRRRPAQPPGLRPDPGALPRRRAGPRLRDARHRHRHLHRGRPHPRRRASSAVSAPSAGWRWIFFVNIPIGIAAVPAVAAPAAGPARRRRAHAVTTSTWSASPCSGAERARHPVPAGPGAAVERATPSGPLLASRPGAHGRLRGSGSGATPRAAREPLVDLSLFSLPGYAPGTTLALVYFAGFTGIFFVLTLYFQTGLRLLRAPGRTGGHAVRRRVGGHRRRRRAVRHPHRPARWSSVGLLLVADRAGRHRRDAGAAR